jgi:hypothetical protein
MQRTGTVIKVNMVTLQETFTHPLLMIIFPKKYVLFLIVILQNTQPLKQVDFNMGPCLVSITQRAKALALSEVGTSTSDISFYTTLSRQAMHDIYDRAVEAGYDTEENNTFRDDFFTDNPCTGRPMF